MKPEIEKMARESGAEVTMLLSKPPKLGRVEFTAAQLEDFVQAVAKRCAAIASAKPREEGADPELCALSDFIELAILAEFITDTGAKEKTNG
ncbi:hypothetical protein [Roseateles sp. P5_E11]